MNPADTFLLYGFALGVVASLLVTAGILAVRGEAKETRFGGEWPEIALPPLSQDDLRLVRLCVICRRYQGEHRTITAGQHLSVLDVTCPRCSKRGAIVKPSVA